MAKTPEELALERRTRKRNQEAIAETERSLKAMARQSSGIRSLLTGVGANVTADPVTPQMNRDVDIKAGLSKSYITRMTQLSELAKKILNDPDRTDEEKRKFIKDNNLQPKGQNFLSASGNKLGRERGIGVQVGRNTINVTDLYSSEEFRPKLKDRL